jgi:hypothetical protein
MKDGKGEENLDAKRRGYPLWRAGSLVQKKSFLTAEDAEVLDIAGPVSGLSAPSALSAVKADSWNHFLTTDSTECTDSGMAGRLSLSLCALCSLSALPLISVSDRSPE